MMTRVARPGNTVEHLGQLLRRERAPIGDSRVHARRRLDALVYPAIEIHQAGAQQPAVVDGAAEILGVLHGGPGIGGRQHAARGRPVPQRVLGAGEVVDAREGAVGVGRATTEAVVNSSLAVLIVNFFLTMGLNIIFPAGHW